MCVYIYICICISYCFKGSSYTSLYFRSNSFSLHITLIIIPSVSSNQLFSSHRLLPFAFLHLKKKSKGKLSFILIMSFIHLFKNKSLFSCQLCDWHIC